MLTVVFGAGASYDSFPDVPAVDQVKDSHIHNHRPPLAKQLFDGRFGDEAKSNPEALSLFPDLREAAKSDNTSVEEILEGISKSASTYSPTFRQLLSMRYYLHDVIVRAENDWIGITSGVLTYRRFLDKLDRWRNNVRENRIALITFNYDTFLDTASTSTLDMFGNNMA